MKATKYLSLAALALMGTLASCQSDDEAAVSFARPANAVDINVSVGSLKGTTRSNAIATDDTQREFNQGDQVCVSTDGQDPVLFQCTNADQQTWAEAEAGKFLLWTQNEMTFKAYYPATTGTSMTNFTLPADQSSTDKIALADYMTRQQTCNNESGTDIYLTLERKTARVIVRIAGFNDQYDNDEKTVSNVSIYSEASGIEDGSPTGSSAEILPYAQGNGGLNTTYTALVVPGYGDDGADFIALTDALNNTLTVKGIPELREGYSYTYDLTVGKNKIQVQSVTVTDWTNGTTLAGGQAQEQGSVSTPLDNTTTAWTAGTFTVPAGGLTYSDAITVSGDVTLTLTDGETLTLNKGISLASGATLTIQGNGTMNVNGTNNSTASTVAGTGTLVLTSGTLNATGGNGQSLTITSSMDEWDYNTGASGGVAINGNVTVSGGTVTATGGNGGNLNTSEIYGGCSDNHGGNGGAAISGTVTVNAGGWTATNGSNGTYTAADDGDYGCSAGTGGKAVAGTVTDNR